MTLRARSCGGKTFGEMIPGRGQRVGSAANSSPVTDGEVIVVYFKSGTVACLDLDGKPQWQINLQERYGKDTLWWDQGTSPVFAAGRVVVAVMQTGGESYLVSLDKQDRQGNLENHRANTRPARSPGDAYTTPQVVRVNGVESIVSWGADHLTAHDAANGKLVWECGGFNPKRANNQRVIASAVVNDEIGGGAVQPRRRTWPRSGLDGRGDVSESHWAWRDDKLGTDAATPVLHDGKIYVLKDSGPKRGRVDLSGSEDRQAPVGNEFTQSSPGLLRVALARGRPAILRARGRDGDQRADQRPGPGRT